MFVIDYTHANRASAFLSRCSSTSNCGKFNPHLPLSSSILASGSLGLQDLATTQHNTTILSEEAPEHSLQSAKPFDDRL